LTQTTPLLPGPPYPLDAAERLLDEGRYGEAAALVAGLRRAREDHGDAESAAMLAEVHRLCVTCEHLNERAHEILRAASSHPLRHAGGALRVQCLGHFAVRAGARTLGPWPNRRAKSLFRYLVLHRDAPVRKEVLMEAFWPGASAPAARNSLNVAIHALRRFLREQHADVSHVVFRDGSYLLDPDLPLWVDVEEWQRLATSACALDDEGGGDDAVRALQAAAALHGGELFEDDPYEEWMLQRRRELHDLYVAVLWRLLDHHLDAGDVELGADAARAILAVEPTAEEAHRALMCCYARQGRPHLALRQLEDCAHVLRDTLDTAPDVTTERLGERIRRHEPV